MSSETPTERTPEREWTDAQKAGITTTGKSLLVSAAAGSGKTTVLAERCVYLVCDAPEPCELSELLVVTFTEPAAAEMKSRIGSALVLRNAKSPNEHTTRQVALLDRASVGTLHGFCSRVLRQHFHKVGLDPDFLILDGDEASLLKRETARELLEDRYEDDAEDSFREFVDSYGDGKDERLVGLIVSAHDTLGSMLDPISWADAAHRRIVEAIENPLNESELGLAYLKEIARSLATLAAEVQTAIALIKSLGSFRKYVERLNECGQIVRRWTELVNAGELDELAGESEGLAFPRMSAVPSSTPNKDEAKTALDAVVDSLKKGRWRDGLRFTEADWQDGLHRIMPHVDTFLSLTSQYTARYDAAKARQNALDFADLEKFALRVLRESGAGSLRPSAIARGYHRQFKHVLVDEYQDINEVQDAILCLISHECLHTPGSKRPVVTNLFCVGDVKQSIYRFRLADPEQFKSRRDTYRGPNANGIVIDLQENFRSRTPLLNGINDLFARMMTTAAVGLEYDASQWLRGKRLFPEPVEGSFSGGPIELHIVPKDPAPPADEEADPEAEPDDRTSREAGVLAKRILQIVGNADRPAAQVVDRATGKHRPARFGDVVVLLRSMKYKSNDFADVFREAGIAVHSESSTGYFEATEINDLLSLLQVLDNRGRDIPLAAVLRSPLMRIQNPDAAMAKIRIASRASARKGPAPSPGTPGEGGGEGDSVRKVSLDVRNHPHPNPLPDYRERGQENIPFHEAVVRYAHEQTDDLAKQLREACDTLDRWRDVARQRPVAELVWLILQETGYLAYVAGLEGGQQRQANVLELYDRAGQFGSFRRQGLARFLEFLEKLKAESDLGQASIASPADDVVRIMSIHRSKGLEFPIVCLPDLGKLINMSDCRGSILLDRDLGLGFDVVDLDRMIRYPSLASKVVSTRMRQQTLAEEMRVLYVAMTRAEEHLILTGTCTPAQAQRWTQRWANHDGPLPIEAILDARTMLDWLGPAAAATASLASPPIEIIRHDEDAPLTAPPKDAQQDVAAAQLAHLADLLPLAPMPETNEVATSVIDRLTRQYAFAKLDATPASLSVTALTHGGHAPPSSTERSEIDRSLALPPMAAVEQQLSAADRGTATHTVLEHLDFSQPATVVSQIAKMVETNRLTPEESAAVDLAAIDWFLHSDIGQLVQRSAGQLHRELPLYLNHVPDNVAGVPLEPMDHIMVRGRIDLLVPDGDGYAIVDYKTDRVEGESLDRRADEYFRQLDLYRKAVGDITGKPVTRAVLVFLSAREIRTVGASR